MDKIHSLKLSGRPLKTGHPEKKTLSKPSIFRGSLPVSFREGIYLWQGANVCPMGAMDFQVKALGGCRAFSVDYPKPPESPFPAALENATW